MIEGMHDSGERQNFETGAVRDSRVGKPRPDLISPYAQMRKGAWMAKGAEKYAPRNWEKGFPISRCIESLERHIQEYKMGLTNEDHMAAVAVNAEFIIHYEEMIARGLLPAELDDMPKYEQRIPPAKSPVVETDVLPVGKIRVHYGEPELVSPEVNTLSSQPGDHPCVKRILDSKLLTIEEKKDIVERLRRPLMGELYLINPGIDTSVLISAFTWLSTPEGHDYWEAIWRLVEEEQRV